MGEEKYKVRERERRRWCEGRMEGGEERRKVERGKGEREKVHTCVHVYMYMREGQKEEEERENLRCVLYSLRPGCCWSGDSYHEREVGDGVLEEQR